jgi:hypothetical protein
MPNYHLEYLSRDNYVSSIETITDTSTLKFADMSLRWWDKQFGWYTEGCIALSSEKKQHLCYIFFKIDCYKEYITIHNIFTPLLLRRNGYAYELLRMVFDIAISKHVKRFKLSSVSKSLDFYLSLGFIYWGMNRVGDYYCDLPMPSDGLNGVETMTQKEDASTLLGKKLEFIHTKVANNDTNLNDSQTIAYEQDIKKMGKRYMLQEISKIKNTQKRKVTL